MDEKIKKFALDYWNWYEDRGRRPNLIGYKSFELFYQQQVLDALTPYIEFPDLFQKNEILLDVGTGGGFPLLVLHYYHKLLRSEGEKKFPHYFIGVDSIRKKLNALEDFLEKYPEYNSNSLKLHPLRLEQIHWDRGATLTFKAVGTCKIVLESIRSFGEEITCLFYKGAEFYALEGKELGELEKKWKLESIRPLQTAPQLGRYLVTYRSKWSKEVIVPRGTVAPVYLSELL